MTPGLWAADPELAAAAEAIRRAGWTEADCVREVTHVGERPETQQRLLNLRQQLRDAGVPLPDGAFERVLLLYAAAASRPRLGSLRVHPKVRAALEQEWASFPLSRTARSAVLGTPGFVSACKIATLRRFPAGPMDWEISGLPRSWVVQAGLPGAARLLWHIARHWRGFRPAFFMHVAREPQNRALVLEREVLRAYYRVASSLATQPAMLGIIAAAWFHDPQALLDNPHLEWLNRPYLEHGGLIVPLGPADTSSGFAIHNPERARRYQSGRLSYRISLALWPRRAALRWVREHPEYDD